MLFFRTKNMSQDFEGVDEVTVQHNFGEYIDSVLAIGTCGYFIPVTIDRINDNEVKILLPQVCSGTVFVSSEELVMFTASGQAYQLIVEAGGILNTIPTIVSGMQ